MNKGIVNKSIYRLILCISLCAGILFLNPAATSAINPDMNKQELIRFHVIANSDSEDDQRLKYAVRDAILKEVAPRLAKSGSLAESREMILDMEDELLRISQQVIWEWGKTNTVSFDYGVFTFPTKSYGNIVLPGGEYEAVEIKIGKAEGANWWCVLYPPLCFVNVEESTEVPVDGKAAVPLDSTSKNKKPTKKVGFLLGRLFD
ncbi:stage II sporulation protein R [Dehalobacter sp. DCM]|uniref:stage II sporulation protein R n=1 Tax=Dehalobacter sp. DCM TaxID=2907827 RepID=UPI003FCDACBF